jgi:predicted lactoylglutathione lyase
MKLPAPVPELPVSDIQAAAGAYASRMGFSLDWTYEDALAGISRDTARVFLRRRTAQEDRERYTVLIWLNMASSAEVDQLHAEWKQGGVSIVEELRTTPYKLREFTAEDLDGNKLRVFFDLGGSERMNAEEATFGRRFVAAVRAATHSAGPWNYAQITRMEKAGRDVLVSELLVTCAFLPPSFTALAAVVDPETLGRHFVEELRRHQEARRKAGEGDLDLD